MMKYIKNTFMYIIALLWVIPLVWTILTAFRPRESTIGSGFSFTFTLSNFAYAWKAAPFDKYYINTIIIVLGILAVQIFTVTLAAYAFARMKFFGRNVLLILVMIQFMIPADALIAPNYNTLRDLSLLDTRLGIMIPYFASAFGIFLLRQTFKTIPIELEEAAKLEGCNLFQIISKIYVPLAKPTYIAFGLVSVSHHWNNFLWPLVVTNSPEKRPLTVGLALLAQSHETGSQWSEVTAATLIVIFPLLVAFFIFQKQFINSFMQSGIK